MSGDPTHPTIRERVLFPLKLGADGAIILALITASFAVVGACLTDHPVTTDMMERGVKAVALGAKDGFEWGLGAGVIYQLAILVGEGVEYTTKRGRVSNQNNGHRPGLGS